MKIEIANRQDALPLDRKTIRSLCRQILADHQREEGVSICVVDDAEMQALNARYLGRDEPTDVLAFPLADDFAPPEEPFLGEVVVSAQRALDEAHRRKVAPERELALYVAHGLLHLLGYDDHTPADQRRMQRAQNTALRRAGLLPRKRPT